MGIPTLIKLGMAIALVAALGWCIHMIQHEAEEAAKYKGLYNAAVARAAQLALDYQAMTDRAVQAEKERDAKRTEDQKPLAAAVAAVANTGGVRLSPAVVGVFNAASRFANGSDAAPTAKEGAAVPAAAQVDDPALAQYIADAAEAYRSAVEDGLACRERYDAARAAQLKETQ